MQSLAAPDTPAKSRLTALGMALCAVLISYANNIDLAKSLHIAIACLTFALAFAAAAIIFPAFDRIKKFPAPVLAGILAAAVIFQAILLTLTLNVRADLSISLGIAIIAILSLCQLFTPAKLRTYFILVIAAVFFAIGAVNLHRHGRQFHGDVQTFQEIGVNSLLHGHNPYTARYRNNYPRQAPFYGPGVVGPDNYLTYGFPYPPLSLLMTLISQLITGDIRYAHLAALALSAILMALARPGKFGALAAAILLLNPSSLYIINVSWTEPLVILNFSLAMFCACRWRCAFPYALGLFFATKQYSILVLPLLPLLLDDTPNRRKELVSIIVKAGLVVLFINLPFLLWNPRAFIRAIVLFQFVQPFRPDTLGYLAWIYLHTNYYQAPSWIVILPLVLAYIEAHRRAARSPAGFAAALTLVDLVFFAFNKQASGNYYFYVVATACWAIAALRENNRSVEQ